MITNTFVSFVELGKSQLATWPITPGEIIFITDTEEIYHTNLAGTRVQLSANVEVVTALPTIGKENKIYVFKGGGASAKPYIYIGGQWIKLSEAGTALFEELIQASDKEPIGQDVGGIWLIVD